MPTMMFHKQQAPKPTKKVIPFSYHFTNIMSTTSATILPPKPSQAISEPFPNSVNNTLNWTRPN